MNYNIIIRTQLWRKLFFFQALTFFYSYIRATVREKSAQSTAMRKKWISLLQLTELYLY